MASSLTSLQVVLQLCLPWTMASSVLFTGGSSSFVYHGQWLVLSYLQVVALALSTMDNGQFYPLFRWQLQLCLPWTMTSSVLFTGGSSSFVYYGQWLALSSLQVVALALSTMDNGQLCPCYRWQLQLCLPWTMASSLSSLHVVALALSTMDNDQFSVLFTCGSSSFVYHGQWLVLCPLYMWQLQLCLPWTMASSLSSLHVVALALSTMDNDQFCPLYRWQLQLCLPWTMASSVLFTGGNSSFVYHEQWLVLSSLQVVALALSTMDNGQLSDLFTGGSSSFVYHGQWLVLSSLHVVALGLSTMDNGQLCPLYRWQLQGCLPWTMASYVLFTGGSSSFVYHGQWLALCPLYRWQLQLCLPWTMASSVLFTGGSSSSVYHGQWIALCPLYRWQLQLCLPWTIASSLTSLQVVALGLSTMDNGQLSVLFTGGSSSSVYHGQWIALCPLYRWQLQLCLPWTMASSLTSLQVVALALSTMDNGQFCPIYRWQLQLCLPWTMASSVLFTGGSSSFVYYGQWLVLSSVQVVALALSTMDNDQFCPLYRWQLQLCLLWTMASSVLFTGGSSSFVYHEQWLVLSSLQVVALALSTMDNGQLCPCYRWQLQLCLPWTMASSVLFTGGSSSFVYHGQWLALCPLYRWQLQLCLPWTMASSVLFTGGSSSFVYHGQWLALCPLYRWQLQLCLPWTMASSVLFTGGSSRFVYHGQWLALSSLQVVALALFTMDNGQRSVLFTGGSYSFVYHGQWLALSSLQVVALALSTMDNGQLSVLFTGGSSRFVYHGQWLALCPLYRWQLQLCLPWTMDSFLSSLQVVALGLSTMDNGQLSDLFTGGISSFVYRGQQLALSSLRVVSLALSTVDNSQLCPLYRWQLQLCLSWTIASSVLFSGGSSSSVYHGQWIALCPLYRWQLQLCLPWTMASSLTSLQVVALALSTMDNGQLSDLFTGGSSSFVYHGQWLALSSLQVVALALSTMDNGQLSVLFTGGSSSFVYHGQQLALSSLQVVALALSTMDNGQLSVLFTGGSSRFVYHGQQLALSSLHVVALSLSTMDNRQLCPLYRWQLQLCLPWTIASSVLFTGGSSSFVCDRQ